MKARHQIERVERLIFDRVQGIDGDEWHRAPRGRWTLAQIVSHLAIGMDLTATLFEQRADKKGMARRATPSQHLLRHLILGVGRLPRGGEAPGIAQPPENPDPEAVLAELRMGIERFRALIETWPEERQIRIFVAHPIFGDFNLPEWVRLHYLHSRYHAAQIDRRVAWLRKQARAGENRRKATVSR